MSNVEILQVLDISTGHLTPQTLRLLSDDPFAVAWPVIGGNTPYGYFIYAHPENVKGEIPADIWACCEFARKHGCSYINFDCDGPLYDDLPSYLEEGEVEIKRNENV